MLQLLTAGSHIMTAKSEAKHRKIQKIYKINYYTKQGSDDLRTLDINSIAQIEWTTSENVNNHHVGLTS